MRLALRLTGTLLILLSLVGLAALGTTSMAPEPSTAAGPAHLAGTGRAAESHAITQSIAQPATAARHAPEAQSVQQVQGPIAQPALVPQTREITQLVLPRIDLAAEVVPAQLVERADGLTWEVPAFKVGHAESTAGAGQVGNAVLLGHVTSLHSGNVFERLDQVQVGDQVQVFSAARQFGYRVVSVSHVPRADASVVAPTSTPSVSLITCSGVWLPTIWDYTERLVVRAELDQPL